MSLPRATLRLQFHTGFTLADAARRVPYFAQLGISHLYASPLTRARTGSMHGYDIVDPTVISAELGGEPALHALVRQLRLHGMGLILDIVPNHLATSAENAWWWSVLEHGPASPYASWFDINWTSADPALHGKVLAPFLAVPYGQALKNGAIRLQFDTPSQRYRVDACGQPYPLAPGTLTAGDDPQTVLTRYNASTPQGLRNLHDLLEKQPYRLAWWRCAADELNWRRFFEISDLIGVRMENDEAFKAVHALPLHLFEQGLIDGLRIDHVDGLADPRAYCRRLRAALETRRARRPAPHDGEPAYLIVEKILAHDEMLDTRWGVDGTTGYDFMDQVGALLHDPEGREKLTSCWQRVSCDKRHGDDLLEEARILILRRHLAAERNTLIRALHQLARADLGTRDCSAVAIGRVLDQLLALFQGYRTYVDTDGSSPADTQRLNQAVQKARARLSMDHDSDDAELLGTIAHWLSPTENHPPDALQSEVVRRFQQLTSSLAAKSLEDTVFYRYGRLVSRNEVGADLKVFALSPDDFHRHAVWRAVHAPRSMLATATHDHKRGEDVRARLAVLSEMADVWMQTVTDWMVHHGRDQVHPADRYMLYQTLVGAWPPELDVHDDAQIHAYTQRVNQWQIKALREAKLRSSWLAPNHNYEAACTAFLEWLMRPGDDTAPRYELARFVQIIARPGAMNSLVQTFLRLTVPGIPDLYQGAEFWDFSLVDPDNRRTVDFDARLDALRRDASSANWRNGYIKQALIRQCLQLRRDYADLLTQGNYTALGVAGRRKAHVIAFVREFDEQRLVGVAIHLPLDACRPPANPDQTGLSIAPHWWEDTVIQFPASYTGSALTDKLSGIRVKVGSDGDVPIAEVLRAGPVALLMPDAPDAYQ